MNIENLLKYQNLDKRLWEVEQKLANSPYKKKANELTAIAKRSQNRSTELEIEAEKLNKDIMDIKEKYEANKKKLEEVLSTDVEKSTMEELEKFSSIKGKLASNLNILEKMLQKCAESINRILSEFNKTKKTFDEARNQFAVCKQKIDEEAKALEPEKDKLRKELASFEKQVDTEILTEYKKKRQDNIFPVVVPLVNGNFCGRCSMELPKVAISRIKEKGVIICEHCKRFIYQA